MSRFLLVAAMLIGCRTQPGAEGPEGPVGPPGPAGEAGPAGADGKDGADGADGTFDAAADADSDGTADWIEIAAGTDPNDGTSAPVDSDGNGVADAIQGIPGADGKDGKDGADGVNGVDGAVGATGAPGADGTNGVDGLDGADFDPAADADADGWPDWVEVAAGTDITNGADMPADTDADGIADIFVGPAGIAGPVGPQGPIGPQGPVGPQGAVGPAGPLPTVSLNAGLTGTGSSSSPLGVTFAGSGTATSASRSDHNHTGTYVRTSVMNETQAATLVGGGNADALHTHAAATSPWFVCGTLPDLTDCAMTGYSSLQFEYGAAYNQPAPTVIQCTQWNRGVRVYNVNPYWVSSDTPVNSLWGGFAWYTATDAADDDIPASCPTGQWRHQYWYLDTNNGVEFLGGNGCNGTQQIYCRERM